jgi:outer membrane protein TolC
MNLNITQPLLKNFGVDINKTNILIAKNDVAVSDFDFKTQVINILSNVQNVYWDLHFTIEDLKVKMKSLDRARDLERTVKAQVHAGTMAPIEVIAAQSEVAARDELVIIARKSIKDNEEILKNAMNIAFDTQDGKKPIRPTDPLTFTVKENIDLDESLKEAFASRPDYMGKKKNLESKNIIIKFNQNQLYPSIDMVASAGVNGMAGTPKSVTLGGTSVQSPYGGNYLDAMGNAFSTNYYQWSLGVQLSYPLGNRSAESRLASSKLDAEQLLLDIKDLEKKIIVDVREAIRLLDTTAKNIDATRVARKLAEERLRAEEKKLKVGLSTSFNVLVLQENLATQESNEIKAVIDYNKAKIKLQQVQGTTLEANSIELSTRSMQ